MVWFDFVYFFERYWRARPLNLNMEDNPEGLVRSAVDNEGCTLVYEYTKEEEEVSAKPLLILIPGGGAQAAGYYGLIPHLSPRFTVVLFDRRQIGRSKKFAKGYGALKPFNPVQQARDVVAVIEAVARDIGMAEEELPQAYVFGSSAGGLVAFQLAISFPEVVVHMIAHEAPSNNLLPEPLCSEVTDWTYELYNIFVNEGAEAAMKMFLSILRGFDPRNPPQTHVPVEDWEYFWRYEWVLVMLYSADLAKVRRNGISIAVAQGADSGDASYAWTSIPQSEVMDCPRLVFPGYHAAFENRPEEFAKAMMDGFHLLEERQESQREDQPE